MVRQPRHGFRAGLDAVMLAASVPAAARTRVLELGSGCGVASLCLAKRVAECTISGIEIDRRLVALANENAKRNRMEGRVSFFEGDVLSKKLAGEFDHVFANPPFNDERGELSPLATRARAKHSGDALVLWVRSGLRRLRDRGTLTVIVRADRLRDVLLSAPEGGICVFPLWPRAGDPAKRAIVQIRKSSHAALAMLRGLVLHKADGAFTAEANAVLRGEAALILSPPRNR